MSVRFTSLFVLLICGLPAAALSDDAKLMQGIWTPIKWVLAGSPTPPVGLAKATLTMKSGRYEFVLGPSHDVGKILLKPGQSPKAMDIVGVKGPNAGKTIPAIYRFDGDKFTVCYGLDGHRPKAFVSPKNSMVLLLTFSRKAAVLKSGRPLAHMENPSTL